MAYFLKQTKTKNRTYLSITESFYSPEKKGTVHRTYKSLQSVETHLENGIKDPVKHFQKEVDRLNNESNEKKKVKISDVSSNHYLGHFLYNSLLNKLKIEQTLLPFKLTTNFKFDLYELISSLVFARALKPCSKRKTYFEVIPNLLQKYDFSYDQLLDGLSFIGNNYEKFVEIFTIQTENIYDVNTEKTYFDCTNFYFEIDREDDFRRKGPSKENRNQPIIGLGLLLDNNQIPIGMKMFPGNQSEKPVLRDIVTSLKRKNNINGRTIHVADKGLNCGQNIAFATINKDGYIFSKSIKQLPESEKEWILLDSDYKEALDKDGNVKYLYKSCIGEFPYTFIHDNKKIKVNLKEKRIVTFNPTLARKKRKELRKMIDKASSITHSYAKKKDYGEASKYFNFENEKGEKVKASLNHNKIQEDLQLAGFNMLVTSELKMKETEIYNTYHNLWKIEESFRIMKSDLDARPAFVQTVNAIKGHFLICYIATLLGRILQYKVFDNKFSAGEIRDYIRSFKVTKTKHSYVNTTNDSPMAMELEERFNLPVRDWILSETKIRSILNFKIKK